MQNITVRLDEATVKAIDTEAEALDRSRSWFIRSAIQAALEMRDHKHEWVDTQDMVTGGTVCVTCSTWKD